MKKSELIIYNEIPENTGFLPNPVVTIGNFDGVHTGHRKIIQELISSAVRHNGVPVVITFRNHPRTLFRPEAPCKIVATIEEKQQILHSLGVNHIIMLQFTRALSNLTADQFYNDLLIDRLKMKEIVIGHDHAFGKNREGNIDYLMRLSQKTGIIVTRVEEEICSDKIISSTFLRNEIEKGSMEMAATLLNIRYSLTGKVVKGAGRGKGIGFPTANIFPDNPDKIVPATGVYAASIKFNDNSVCYGMLNIGYNPTFEGEENSGRERSIEINIFDFNRDIYGETVTIEFFKRIRDEIKFDSVDSLVKQIKKDEVQVMEFFSANFSASL